MAGWCPVSGLMQEERWEGENTGEVSGVAIAAPSKVVKSAKVFGAGIMHRKKRGKFPHLENGVIHFEDFLILVNRRAWWLKWDEPVRVARDVGEERVVTRRGREDWGKCKMVDGGGGSGGGRIGRGG